MKKLLNILISLSILLSLCSCKTSPKTTVDSKEEWDALFDPDKYLNVELVETAGIPEVEDYTVLEMYRDNNILKVDYRYEKEQASYYYIKSEDSLTLKTYMTSGSNTYIKTVNTFNSKEELDEYFNEVLSVIGLVGDYKDFYEKAQYDNKKDCYYFTYGLYNDDEDAKAELYIKDGVIYKKVFYYENYLGEQQADVNTYINVGEVKILEPVSKETVDNEEQWRDLFNIDKYKNCSAYISDNDGTYLNQISENIIRKEYYDSDFNLISQKYYLKTNENDYEAVSSLEGEDYVSENIYYPYDNLTCFEDHFINDTFNESFADYYNDLVIVDDHYELSIGDRLIKIFISNNYIIEIDVIENDEVKTIALSDFGITVVDVVE